MKHLRPQDDRKIHSKDEFELCYLRHKYLRRSERNPSKEEMAPYRNIIRKNAFKTFNTYQNLFGAVGFTADDLMSIGQIQLVSFLCLFSVEANAGVKERFLAAFAKNNTKLPKEADNLDRNKAIFTSFIKQRFEDVVRVCRQKARNIKGTPTEEYEFFYGPNAPIDNVPELLTNYADYGFKKTDLPTYRAARKKAFAKGSVFQYNGMWWVCIPMESKPLSADDLIGADMDPHDLLHNMTPEELYLAREEAEQYEAKVLQFHQLQPKQRAKIIRTFIRKNRKSLSLAEEIDAAEKMLSLLEKQNG